MKKVFCFSLLVLLMQYIKAQPAADSIHYAAEKHFANLQQLTFGGDNAEAYFSFDGQWLIFQKTNQQLGYWQS